MPVCLNLVTRLLSLSLPIKNIVWNLIVAYKTQIWSNPGLDRIYRNLWVKSQTNPWPGARFYGIWWVWLDLSWFSCSLDWIYYFLATITIYFDSLGTRMTNFFLTLPPISHGYYSWFCIIMQFMNNGNFVWSKHVQDLKWMDRVLVWFMICSQYW